MFLSKLFLIYALGSGVQALPSIARQELESCLTAAVSGDASRAQFRHETDYVANDVKYYNLNYKYNPLSVVYPQTTQEISSVLSCASKNQKKVQARSGGRDFIGKCLGGQDDAVVVDMKHFSKVDYDSSTEAATVGPGNLLQPMVEALDKQGRAMPHGSSATVGVGGHIMVGGMGYLSRQYGLAVDNLLEVEVVLANGTVARASKDQNQELFWAMKGAGASFGIATEFKFQTKAKPQEVVTFSYTYTSSDKTVLAGALKGYQKLMANSTTSRKLGASGVLTKSSLSLSGAFFGTSGEFEALGLDSQLPTPTSKTVTPGESWIGFMGSLFTQSKNLPAPDHLYARDTAVAHDTVPSDDTVDKFVDYILTTDAGSATWMFLFDLYGGAMNDVARDATPFPHRNVAYFLTAYASTGSTTGTPEATMKFVDTALETLQNNQPGKYLNYAGVPSKRIGSPQAKYWGDNLARLEEIKSRIDPDDLFSTPQNIKPKTA